MDLIQRFIDTRQYETYLEVGVSTGRCWNQIRAPRKTGVDPACRIQDIMAQDSDTFFLHNTATFDIIFIDGDHQYDQVIRDINNAWSCLNQGGVIVLHDMMPVNHRQASNPRIKGDPSWCGDVYKANFDLRQHAYRICEIDHGCGIITELHDPLEGQHHHIDFQHFEDNIHKIPRVRFEDINFEM